MGRKKKNRRGYRDEGENEGAMQAGKESNQRDEQDDPEIVRVDPESGDAVVDPGSEVSLDFSHIDAEENKEEILDDIVDFIDDEEVIEDFAERQRLTAGSNQLLEDIRQHHSQSPDRSADDLDAAWEYSDQSGEESVGGTVSTPDQDIVSNLGEAVGLTYDDNEELDTEDRLIMRDQRRWELNPASADPEGDEDEEEELDILLEEDEVPEALKDEDELETLDEEDLLEDEYDDEDEEDLDDFLGEGLDEFLDDLLEDDSDDEE